MYNEFWKDGPKFLSNRAFNIGTDAVMLYAFCRKMRFNANNWKTFRIFAP